MKKVIILSVIFTSLFIAEAFAQTSIKAEVDKTIVTTDDAITYKLIITSSEENIPKPQLPRFTGFKIISSALVIYSFIYPAPLARGGVQCKDHSRLCICLGSY